MRASFDRRTEPDRDLPDIACAAVNFRLDIFVITAELVLWVRRGTISEIVIGTLFASRFRSGRHTWILYHTAQNPWHDYSQ